MIETDVDQSAPAIKIADHPSISITATRYMIVMMTVFMLASPKLSMWYTLKNVKTKTRSMYARKTIRSVEIGIMKVWLYYFVILSGTL